MRRPIACPTCGLVNDHHDGPTSTFVPKPGDVGICWGCRNLQVFTVDGSRVPTEEEAARFAEDPNIRRVLAAMAESYSPDQAVDLVRGQDEQP